jgi:mannose-1-phosphate guanylyltransferase
MNIVIMAGGGGSRLWPLSRKDLPKQFLDLGTGKTLLEHTYDRAVGLAGTENIYIATTKQYQEKIQELLPQVPAQNLFLEPERRETGPAFAAAAVQLNQLGKGEEATLFLWADHVFTNEQELLGDLATMRSLIEENPNRIVIIGHTPVSPETGFGYMKMGEKVSGHDDVYVIDSFKEKPDEETAKQYVLDGTYFWNIGYMCVTPSFLLQELHAYAPELHADIMNYAKALQEEGLDAAAKVYSGIPKIAIDYALNERTPNIIAITGDYGWSDVGSWAVVKQLFGTDGDHVPLGHHVHVDSHNNYVYNATKKAVSLVGIQDTIVVVTDNALLVTDIESSQKVKEVVSKLEASDKKEYI